MFIKKIKNSNRNCHWYIYQSAAHYWQTCFWTTVLLSETRQRYHLPGTSTSCPRTTSRKYKTGRNNKAFCHLPYTIHVVYWQQKSSDGSELYWELIKSSENNKSTKKTFQTVFSFISSCFSIPIIHPKPAILQLQILLMLAVEVLWHYVTRKPSC